MPTMCSHLEENAGGWCLMPTKPSYDKMRRLKRGIPGTPCTECGVKLAKENWPGWYYKANGIGWHLYLCPDCAFNQGYKVPIWTNVFSL
tara:strand:- start:90 stop:356 length:267 start_codon:yes stop_codon:yes gene_type:complete